MSQHLGRRIGARLFHLRQPWPSSTELLVRSRLIILRWRSNCCKLGPTVSLHTMRPVRFMPVAAGIAALILSSSLALAQGQTSVHEKGRCAIRGHCGKKSIFGGELPCPDNGLAREPEDAVREKLVKLCGTKWQDGPVCCEEEQVRCHASGALYGNKRSVYL